MFLTHRNSMIPVSLALKMYCEVVDVFVRVLFLNRYENSHGPPSRKSVKCEPASKTTLSRSNKQKKKNQHLLRVRNQHAAFQSDRFPPDQAKRALAQLLCGSPPFVEDSHCKG